MGKKDSHDNKGTGCEKGGIWDLVHWPRDNCVYQSVRKKGSKDFKTGVRC